ncbi:hypothetical protein BD311DRAFT_241790 [Dichomitus squalens]|uniref:BTB domain-containing protein n=1 Tax=Dichomitus squalens TaxID=114155 RepID=A0A4Q9MU52_9APHY|nr:hypothetical protein BD311DRAFT_241790 [Dichomitus squalens]
MDSPEHAFYWQDLTDEEVLFFDSSNQFVLDGLPLGSVDTANESHGATASQLLTPPSSDTTSPWDRNIHSPPPEERIISISTAFQPTGTLLQIPPDTVLIASDRVLFYTHSSQILSATQNRFNGHVLSRSRCPPGASKVSVIPLPDSAAVLNVVLHVVYNISCAYYNPDIATLMSAVDALAVYGYPPQGYVTPSSPLSLYALILSQAPTSPIQVYATAAAHGLHDLAVAVSSHLLSFPVHTLSDELATRIGSVYLKRLCFMQLGRVERLLRLLRALPHIHPEMERCNFVAQKRLARAWGLASASLAWDAKT